MIRKLLGLFLLLASSLAFAVPAAYVHEMTGSGSAAAGGKSRALAVGGLLESGDVISVDKGGAMTVKFEDGQIVVLQENSRFAIEKYDYNKKNVSQSSVAMSLLSGGMRFITGVIGGTRKEAIAMKAGTATIGIRGTDLAINIAGITYVVTVQQGNIVLTAQNVTIPVAQGQGTTGQTNQAPPASRPVGQLPPAVVTLVAGVTSKAVPATNPVGVAQQATLVAAVDNATKLATAAQAPGATDAQKAAAALAAQQVQTAITGALQATAAAIQQAITAGAPQTTATGTAAKTGTQPGVTPPRATQSEVQQIVATVNANLPPAQQLNAAQINQIQQQIAPALSNQPGTLPPAGTQPAGTPPPGTTPLTPEQQAALAAQQTLINTILTPPPPPPQFIAPPCVPSVSPVLVVCP
jgi:hypothetical protein